VAPKGRNIERSLLTNGYAPNSSFIGNDYNGTLPRNLLSEYCNRTLHPTIDRYIGNLTTNRKTLPQQSNALNNNRTVGNGVFYPARSRVIKREHSSQEVRAPAVSVEQQRVAKSSLKKSVI
jgi:hypothetical protein